MDLQTGEFTRKLAAIVSADVKGYSRLMENDDVATVSTLKACRHIVGSRVTRYRGRVVDSPGDNILAEFGSVHDAVRCAFSVQEEIAVHNQSLPQERRMEFRIGINVGDILQEGERIYGDGVNIAARIEALARGGGICISAAAFEHIRSKMALRSEDIGEHQVKNISEPIRVYRLFDDNGHKDNTAPVPGRGKFLVARPVKPVVILLCAGALAAVFFLTLSRRPPAETSAVAVTSPSANAAGAAVNISFEDIRKDTGIWIANGDHPEIRLNITGDNASHGFFSLKVFLPGGEYPGITTHKLPHDWRSFGSFSFAVFLEGSADHEETLGVRIDDAASDSFHTRFNHTKTIRGGQNEVTISLEQVGHTLDVADIRTVIIFLENPSGSNTLFLDNIRLE